MSQTANRLVEIGNWIDAGNAARDPEAITWGRLAKCAEESGEVIRAFIGFTGQNPRKGITHSLDDVKKELLDVAVTALSAWEHIDGSHGDALIALYEHILFLHKRVGLLPEDGVND